MGKMITAIFANKMTIPMTYLIYFYLINIICHELDPRFSKETAHFLSSQKFEHTDS